MNEFTVFHCSLHIGTWSMQFLSYIIHSEMILFEQIMYNTNPK